ncbi:tRNA lysidine(34) synthetase TilS [Shewanella inventionis]|uniref:tRNA(Ile)-lysidine synthase n=1 Tax=Shewanella inventionis TaxID=1738770 RepID=A0ABQ1J7U9_9GAMM|nr:tRNA lysidine(34) synthetase TilS [Shewanella inventionis]MCL1158653.1 tRNA lysidine(34) synthetase TilS [Shewanella inventionis]GGB62013.1 tRNA(Ile)-lysidine synthase [Shewanella inventionis]
MTAEQLLLLLEQAVLPLYPQGISQGQQQPKLVLAYSGGVDSEVLAFGLSRFSHQYPHIACLLIHVHHGLSDNANIWVQHCIARASHYQLPIQIERVNVEKGARQSLEAKAREARYQAFDRYLNPGDILLTAHHQDDQLETLLLALKRGQGPKGLAAMGALQTYKQAWLVRPLLDISRDQIEQFAAQKQLVHIEDESNQDDSFDRNFLRLDIIPRLKQRWPGIATTAARSAALCAEQQQVIDNEVSHRLPQWLIQPTDPKALVTESTGFVLAGFAQLTPAWQALLFRGYLSYCDVSLPSQSQLQQILSQLLEAKDDANVAIQWGDFQIKRFAGIAYVLSNSALEPLPVNALQHDIRAVLLGEQNQASGRVGQLAFVVQKQMQAQMQQGVSTSSFPLLALPIEHVQVTVKFGAAGSIKCLPQFASTQRSKPRELKKLWQECHIPPWRRQQIPLIFYGDVLVAAIGLWIDQRYLAAPGQAGLSLPLLNS